MTTKLEQDLKALLENTNEDKSLLEAVKKKMEDEESVAPAEQPVAVEPEAPTEEPPVSIENPINPELIPPEEPEVVAPVEQEPEQEKKEVKEDTVDSVLSEEFDDEFKTKATALFESALASREIEIRKEIEEEFSVKEVALTEEFDQRTQTQTAIFEERVAELENALSEKIDGYIGQVAEEWMSDNVVAIESSIKTDIAESFIMEIKKVFKTHNIDLPEADVKVVESLQEEKQNLVKQIEVLKSQLSEQSGALASLEREKIIEETVKGFTEMDKAKFKTLVENFEFESGYKFERKLEKLKESFFSTKDTRNSVTEEFAKKGSQIMESTTEVVELSPRMQSYLKAL